MNRPRVRRWQRGIVVLVLTASILAVYGSVRDHEFVDFDDHDTIVNNPNLEGPLDLEALGRHFGKAPTGNWVPLTWISLHLDRVLYGADPAGFHLTNVALHLLATLLLFLFLTSTTGSIGCSALVSAVWALHPLRVESVAWASERKDLLCGAFCMATLLAHSRAARDPSSRIWRSIVVACLALALLAKPMAVSVPILLLLIDVWPLRRVDPFERGAWRTAWGLVREKIVPFALAFAAAGIALSTQHGEGSMRFGERFEMGDRLRNALVSYVVYLRQSIWPVDLSFFYPHPGAAISSEAAIASAVLLLVISVAGFSTLRRNPPICVGWIWFLVSLVPVIGLVQTGMQARADRYTYLPSVGLWIAVIFGAAQALRSRPTVGRLAFAATTVAVCGLALRSHEQVGTWRDSRSLFAHAIAVDASNHLAHQKLGLQAERDRDLAAADYHYRRAIEVAPEWALGWLSLAEFLTRTGDLEEASTALARGTDLDPSNAQAWAKRGLVEQRLGRTDAAEAHLLRSIDLGLAAPAPLVGMAMIERERGNLPETEALLRRALEADPNHVRAASELVRLLVSCEDDGPCEPEAAIEIGERIADSPGSTARFHDAMARAYARVGALDRAVAESARAARMAARRGDSEEAEQYRNALRAFQLRRSDPTDR